MRSLDTPTLRRNVALLATVATGVVAALLAYAGGGDLLSEFFGGRSPDPTPDTYDAVPAAVVLDSLVRDSGVSPAVAALVAARDSGKRVASQVGSDSAAAGADSAAVTDTNGTEDGSGAGIPEVRQPRGDSAGARRADGRARFQVQVRATADRAEAEQLARRLRGRGLREVSITESSRERQALYRVRYGAYGTEKEARESAERVGLSDFWIVRP